MKRNREVDAETEMKACGKRSTIRLAEEDDSEDMSKLFQNAQAPCMVGYGAHSKEEKDKEDGLEQLRQFNGLEVVYSQDELFLVDAEADDSEDMSPLSQNLQGPSCKLGHGANSKEEKEEDGLKRLRQFNALEVIYSQNKLFLVLDLDHTLLNSVHLSRVEPDEALRIPYLLDNASHGVDIHKLVPEHFTKLRPFVHDFLRQASSMFEMYIYTMGTRSYAEAMVRLLDPSRQFFGGRIISRDDNSSGSKSKSLDFILAPPWASIILDDSPNVWPNFLANLVQIDRYHFFDSSSKHFNDVQGPSLLGSLQDESHTTGALARTLDLLRRVHHAFFDDIEASSQESTIVADKDVRQILHGLRCNLLAGCKIAFSGIFPSGASYDPKAHPLWCHAEQLGAVCSTTLDDSVTHVLAFNAETETVKWAACYLDCYLVHPLWIEATYFTWERAAESEYYAMDPTPKPTTFSKMASLLMLQDELLRNTSSLKVPTHEQQSCGINVAGEELVSTVQCC